MSESDQATIPIHDSRSRGRQANTVPIPEIPLRTKMPRPSIVAFLSILLLCVGWGTWRYVCTSRTINDEASVADLDGFEFAPPFLSAPMIGDPSAARQGDAIPSIAAPETTEGIRVFGIPTNSLTTNELATPADVWLTGTIEETEPTENIRLPRRISDGPGESSILR